MEPTEIVHYCTLLSVFVICLLVAFQLFRLKKKYPEKEPLGKFFVMLAAVVLIIFVSNIFNLVSLVTYQTNLPLSDMADTVTDLSIAGAMLLLFYSSYWITQKLSFM